MFYLILLLGALLIGGLIGNHIHGISGIVLAGLAGFSWYWILRYLWNKFIEKNEE